MAATTMGATCVATAGPTADRHDSAAVPRRRTIFALAGAAASAAFTPGARAQAWPSKPIRAVVGFPAGGVVDVMARTVAERASAELGQSIVVDNRPGAGGNLAVEAVHGAPRDGYACLVSSNFLFVNPALEAGLRWRFEDFEPVARYALSPSFLLVPADAPYSTVAEWAEAARRRPGMQFGDGGAGTTQTMAMRMLARSSDLRLESVYYKGAPQMVQDLVGGQLATGMIPSTVAIPAVKGGRVKALATTGERRSPELPTVPTMAEAGFPSATALSWYGLHVPAGTPGDAVRRLARAVEVACASADVRARLAGAGGEEAYLGADRFAEFLQVESKRWLALLAEGRKPGG